MKSYKYLHICECYDGVRVTCTDEKILKWIAAEVKKIIPGCNVDNGLYCVQLRDEEIQWWIMQQLCQQG
jgi:hypothetical protein